MKSYIDWVLVEEKPKTDVFIVFSKSSLEELGTIKWYAPWRQYCFFPLEGTAWSLGCLNEVGHMLIKAKAEWKARSSRGKAND